MKRFLSLAIIAAMLGVLLGTPVIAGEVSVEEAQETESLTKEETLEEDEVSEEAVPKEAVPEETVPEEAPEEASPEWSLSPSSSAYLGDLLTHLVNAYENGSSSEGLIQAELSEIQAVSEEDYALAKAIADEWHHVFLSDYPLYLYEGEGEDVAQKLSDAGIPNDASHAIVVLGYELLDGEMQDELKGRC